MQITELKYSNTNTYLIEGDSGSVLVDTGWAGTFQAFCSALGAAGKKLQDIDYVLITHFHPDHMGIAQDIADHGPVITVLDLQLPFVHSSDAIFAKDARLCFLPIEDDRLNVITAENSREFLQGLGLSGEIINSPGHSDDSISLWLDEGYLFVGDLNPLYELELHKGTQIEETWLKLLQLCPSTVYYGHAKPAELSTPKQGQRQGTVLCPDESTEESDYFDLYRLVSHIMKYIDKGYPLDKIEKKTGADKEFIEAVSRMYLTHQNVGVQGILDRLEIKGK
ncbi:Glyoxylase, beta-lactamase superfamily II [Lachnospiraceae bacterium NE2001]|nr:Glyoxylase, beta-lactamase superfamily II [Lachnospiraceae bacterium NE2001]